jgi:hypothetical protein
MITNVTPYPLCWPPSRHRARARKDDHFHRLTPGKARDGLYKEMERLRATNVVVSTDCPLRLDGAFRVDSKPVDPGVAVYFRRNGIAYVMACDTYHSFAGNLRGLALTIESIRAIERHGDAVMMQQALGGFRELPAAAHRKAWWEVLGVNHTAGIREVKRRHRELLTEQHPDQGGSAERAAELGRALLEARTDLGDIAQGEAG